jgi:hypothetical protein
MSAAGKAFVLVDCNKVCVMFLSCGGDRGENRIKFGVDFGGSFSHGGLSPFERVASPAATPYHGTSGAVPAFEDRHNWLTG